MWQGRVALAAQLDIGVPQAGSDLRVVHHPDPHRYHERMDSRLQSLHRAWQASGSTADEAAYLLERVRVGDLTNERLELAAYCGHAGAREALGDTVPEVPEDAEAWLCGLIAWGFPTLVRATVIIAEDLLTDPVRGESLLVGLVDTARKWIECPCETHRRVAWDLTGGEDGAYYGTLSHLTEEEAVLETCFLPAYALARSSVPAAVQTLHAFKAADPMADTTQVLRDVRNSLLGGTLALPQRFPEPTP